MSKCEQMFAHKKYVYRHRKMHEKKLNILFYLLADADFELILLPIADVVVANKELL